MALTSHPLFRLLPTPAGDSAMGGCYIYHTQDPCIDTGVLIAYEGNLTIGLQALREMCEVAGFRFNEDGVKLEEENARLTRHLIEMTNRCGELEELLEQDAALLGKYARVQAEPKPEPEAKFPAKAKR